VTQRPAPHKFAVSTRRSPRRGARLPVTLAGRLTWKDDRGMPRFASVVTRDVSEEGVYLECRGGEPIPLYRLVYLQLERDGREVDALPDVLREGRVLSAIYRVGPSEPETGSPSGYALRLLVDPRALANAMRKAETRSIA
jgi:hypothetical protein